MAALILVGPATAVAVAAPAPVKGIARWRPFVVEASQRFGVPMTWIERVMLAESRARTTLNGVPIRSSRGAMGLMQIMPATWQAISAALGLGSNPDDPRANILAGTYYLRLLYDRFGYPGLFAAYNAGPARYADHLATGTPLPNETIGYLATVGATATAPARTQATDPLFALPSAGQGVPAFSSTPSFSSLFAVRRDGR